MNDAEFESEVRKKYREITLSLIKNDISITTMESCTSGQIASLLTDTEGASAIFKGAFVTYSNEAKIRQGVPSQVIDTYGVYSKETAAAMAEAAMKAYDSDISIGVTGTMGNVDPANSDSCPGRVYYAIGTRQGTKAESFLAKAQKSRYMYKLVVADRVADELIKALINI